MIQLLPPAELDLVAYRDRHQPPVYVFPKATAGEVWHVAASPLTDDAVRWMVVSDGTHVFVPTFRYLTAPVLEGLFGFGMQLAVQGLAQLPPPARESDIRALQLVIGRPTEDLRPEHDAFAVVAGLAVRTQ
jgi:hypothetical protein